MKRGQIYVTIVLLFLGIMVTVQVRATRMYEQNIPSTRAQELSARLKDVKTERDNLLIQVSDLRRRLDQVASGHKSPGQAVKEELDKARAEAGLVAVRGRGVEVTLNDSPKELQPGENPNLFILHEEDLLKVVNELRAGGAEAISINGNRLLATSEIRCAGNSILVNTRKIAPPIVMLATGNPDTLASGLQIKGGIFDTLRLWGLIAEVKKTDDITIPAYNGPIEFNYSRPVK